MEGDSGRLGWQLQYREPFLGPLRLRESRAGPTIPLASPGGAGGSGWGQECLGSLLPGPLPPHPKPGPKQLKEDKYYPFTFFNY